ncbi:MAG: sulfatase-like hydrolase/transferase, partial [Chloroflexota bacterium]
RQVYCSNMPAELYPTSFVTERTLSTLDQFSQNDAPFFLNISYPDPHHPFCPPEPYYGMYADEKIPLPNTFYDPHENSLVHHQRTVAERGKDTIGPFLTSPSEAQYQAAAKAEYGSITMLDEGIGRILMRLDELGLAEKTTIIFCSDHGDMFGDHGLMLKFGCHYDGTVRVPFLFKTPHLQAGATNSLASLIDIAPTVLELAGCQPYVGIQGKSLKPILEDKNAVTRDTVFIEEDLPFDMLGVGQATSIRTLITQDTRLTVYAGATHGELFDLETDNSEIDNVYGSAEHSQLKSDMMTDLVHTMTVHHPIDRKV